MFLNIAQCQPTICMLQTLQWGGLGWGWIGGGLEEKKKEVVSGWLGFRLKTFKVANAATYKKLHLLKKMFSFCQFLNYYSECNL